MCRNHDLMCVWRLHCYVLYIYELQYKKEQDLEFHYHIHTEAREWGKSHPLSQCQQRKAQYFVEMRQSS